MSSDTPAHLEPSELGTKEYWDKLYTNELSNHAADPSDIGTVWFDDSDAEAKILQFLSQLAKAADSPLGRETTSFLDLGCGNGSLLFSLRDGDDDDNDDNDEEEGDSKAGGSGGWAGRMLGVDYSAQSVALAKQVAASRAEDADQDEAETSAPVEFQEWDALFGPLSTVLNGQQEAGWDVALDKGTFDAISLSDEKDPQGRRLCEGYRDRVLQVLKSGGLFVVTSCNWTEAELTSWFQGHGADGGFTVVDRVQYRTFTFGGAKGQTISTLCFRKP